MKVTFITRADVHIADHAPEMRSDDWRSTIMGKLRQINQLARDCQASAILDAGDLFYIKSPLKNSHRLVSDLIELHQEAPCPTLAVPGNHDITHDNLKSLEKQPLNVLFQSKSLQEMDKGYWVESPEGPRVWVVGIPYQKHLSVLDIDIEVPSPKPDAVVVVVHYFASKTGGDFHGTSVLKYEDLRRTHPEVDAWVFGHWHQDQGIEWIDDVPFINVGAVSRGALRDESLDRIPKSGKLTFKFSRDPQPAIMMSSGQKRALYRLDQTEAEEIQLNVRPASEVFRIEEKERIDTRMEKIQTFAEELKNKTDLIRSDGVSDDVGEAMAQLSENLPAEVLELTLDYLREAGVSCI